MRIKTDLKNLQINLEDYWPDWSDPRTDRRLVKIKDRLEALELWEKNLLLLYAREGSYRKVGDILSVSYGSVSHFIKIIRNKLLNGISIY